jgi:hypothetical protein
MKYFADLHIHSKYSDGTDTILEILKIAKYKKLGAIALTDHNTLQGIPELLGTSSLEVIPGVEISCIFLGAKLEILGYFIDEKNSKLNNLLKGIQKYRVERIKHVLKKLESYNIYLQFRRIMDIAGSSTVGMAHVALAMVEKGYVRSTDQAFSTFLGPDGCVYLPSSTIHPSSAIEAIISAGGIPTLAHPFLVKLNVSSLVKKLTEFGLKGIEVGYPYHKTSSFANLSQTQLKEMFEILKKLGKKNNLVITAGSDYHGSLTTRNIGDQGLNFTQFINLKKLKHTY